VLSPQTRQQIEQDIKQLGESLAAGRPVRLSLGDNQEIALPAATIELIREPPQTKRTRAGRARTDAR
jgi:hypothetical protein